MKTLTIIIITLLAILTITRYAQYTDQHALNDTYYTDYNGTVYQTK